MVDSAEQPTRTLRPFDDEVIVRLNHILGTRGSKSTVTATSEPADTMNRIVRTAPFSVRFGVVQRTGVRVRDFAGRRRLADEP